MGAPTNIWYSNIGAVEAGGVNTLDSLNDPDLAMARVKLITAQYTMTGNEVANDVIYVKRLPQGVIVDPTTGSNIASQAVASTATLLLGDTDTQGGTVAYDPARYSAALTITSGNTTVGFPLSGGTALNAPAQITDDWVWLVATFATLSVPVAGKVITFRIRVSALD
jgi:hypothetical protein